jgi:signal peptidase I
MTSHISHHAFSTARTNDLFVDMSTELLREGKSVRFQAPGRSMHPTIREGETITVQPAKPWTVKKKDIILYRLERRVIAHRVIRIETRNGNLPCFILRGDASGACDDPVEPGQVLGRVVSVERAGRIIDPYSLKGKLLRIAHVWASRLKRFITPAFYSNQP